MSISKLNPHETTDEFYGLGFEQRRLITYQRDPSGFRRVFNCKLRGYQRYATLTITWTPNQSSRPRLLPRSR